ncbi:uncharacterized protein METZ01_LOCUS316349 [marine metagenome]|uniref:FlgO domain-containing protein n=1 Tax=marine metagenome TaxID=408172 RepID=A0A382NT30_9ZZZZ|tara:strand:+ start:46 stop:651 length:606 start_codon:yes stop_codon:yes gene_type:complete
MAHLLRFDWFRSILATGLLSVGVVGLLSGCSDVYTGASFRDHPAQSRGDVDLVANSHRVTERLVDTSQQILDREKPIIVASLVDVSDLEQSSVLGRIVGEQISSRLTQLGYTTQEMRFRGNILVREGDGELALSRDVQKISKAHEAQAVVTGVYAVADNTVYVTLRLIRAHDSLVISSFDYSLPKNENISSLLAMDSFLIY